MLRRNIIHKGIAKLFWKGAFDWMPEKTFIKFQYWARMGEKADLENPKLFTEKLAWLKLYDHNLKYSKLVDKYTVKDIVSNEIGSEHVIPLLGVWNSFEDIDFDKLPNQFVLKCNHDCGSIFVCKDKNNFDYEAAKKKISKAMKKNYYVHNKEFAYKNVPRKIIAEKYIDSLGRPDSVEYKITCFDGKVGFVTICKGIAHSTYEARTNDTFDRNFNLMPWHAFYKNSGIKWKRPEKWDEMIEYSEKLSKDIPQVRVDWYVIDDTVYFGEMTFYTWGGTSTSSQLNGMKSWAI